MVNGLLRQRIRISEQLSNGGGPCQPAVTAITHSYARQRYAYFVRVKGPVILPDDLLEEIDNAGLNRSSFLARAARKYLADLNKNRRDRRDAEILNAQADRLNLDVPEYQDAASAYRRRR